LLVGKCAQADIRSDFGVLTSHPIYLWIAMSERFKQYKAKALEWERLAAEAKSPMARSCYQSQPSSGGSWLSKPTSSKASAGRIDPPACITSALLDRIEDNGVRP
jgi:hypothetical protein